MKNSSLRYLLAGLLAFIIGFNVMTVAANAEEKAKFKTDFTLKDQDGKDVSLLDYKGKIVVLEWVNPDCPFTKRHYKADINTATNFLKEYKGKPVVWLGINSTHYFDQEKNKAWHKQKQLKHKILDDNSGEVGRQYKARTTPHVFIIDKAGELAYNGAIDNDPRGNKPVAEKVNYVKQVVDELLAGKEPSITQTKSYGCTVKYKN